MLFHVSLSVSVALALPFVKKESKQRSQIAWSKAKVPLCVEAVWMMPKFEVSRLQVWQVPFTLNEGKKIKQMYCILSTHVKLGSAQ